jgi:hypothetical protein
LKTGIKISLLAATKPQKKKMKISVVNAPLLVDFDMAVIFPGKLI